MSQNSQRYKRIQQNQSNTIIIECSSSKRLTTKSYHFLINHMLCRYLFITTRQLFIQLLMVTVVTVVVVIVFLIACKSHNVSDMFNTYTSSLRYAVVRQQQHTAAVWERTHGDESSSDLIGCHIAEFCSPLWYYAVWVDDADKSNANFMAGGHEKGHEIEMTNIIIVVIVHPSS